MINPHRKKTHSEFVISYHSTVSKYEKDNLTFKFAIK